MILCAFSLWRRNPINLSVLLVLLLIVSHFTNAQSLQVVDKSPVPSWVKKVVIPDTAAMPKAQIQNGVYYLLVDKQVKVEADGQVSYFSHYADHIINQDGVEQNSQLNFDYYPDYQSLTLHRLQILRDGQVIDKLNSARMTLLQREEEMNNLIYNGAKTLNIVLDDVRVGDTIQYSFTREGRNPVYNGVFANHTWLNWSVPVARLSKRILWKKSSPLFYEVLQSNLTVTEKQLPEGIEYSLQVDNNKVIYKEDDAPDWYEPWGSLLFSESKSWQEVANWGQSLYEGVFVSDQAIQDLAQQISRQYSNESDRIAAALGFVQDEIRYLGIELGVNSHKPRAAYNTLKNRYGDCKDKTVLFITLLKELGVEAYPVLVNTQEHLQGKLAHNQAFNHVITLVMHQGKKYWLDPTRNYQFGGLDYIYQPDYEYALVLKPGTQQLTLMQPKQAPSGTYVEDTYHLQEPTKLISKTQYKGWNAASVRAQLASRGETELQKSYLEFYQGYFSGARVAEPISFSDNQKQNRVTLTEQYFIENFWKVDEKKQRKDADFYATIIRQWVYVPDQEQRQDPLFLTYPRYAQQRLNINLTDENWNFENEQFIEDNDFFSFKFEAQFEPAANQLILNYFFENKVKFVPAARYPEYRAAMQRATSYTGYGIFKSTATAVVDEPEPAQQSSGDSLLAIIVTVYLVLIFTMIVLWLRARKRKEVVEGELFYPVASTKLLLVWVLSFGIYGVYWFYKNFTFLKQQNNDTSMPLARGIFHIFWYYPLWSALAKDSEQRFQKKHLPNTAIAILCAVLFFIAGLINDSYLVFTLLVSGLLVLPMASYIEFANGKNSAAYIKNSKWAVHHLLLAMICLPLLILSLGSSTGLTASDSVVPGSKLLAHDKQFMQRQGIVKPQDSIEYFYSDAFLFIRNDGNGFTERHVFSYWKNDKGELEKQLADYSAIEKIDVSEAQDVLDNTVVTITRKDGSSFMLYVSVVDNKDKQFVKQLKSNWRKYR